MARSSHAMAWRLAAAALVAGALAGCGKKGPPLPPLRENPAAATDLALYQQGNEWVLRAAYPKTTVAGLSLPGLEAVEVWTFDRPLPPPAATTPVPATTPAPTTTPAPATTTTPTTPAPATAAAAGTAPTLPAPDPREFQAQAKLVRTLRGVEIENAVVGDHLQVRVPAGPAGGSATAFALRTISVGGDASAFSNLVTAVAATAPEPPASVTTTARGDGVEVTWAPATPAPAAYRVYRRNAQARGYGEPIHQAAATETRYLDWSARLGERYVYTVAALGSETPLVVSQLSAESEVDYQDVFPPPPPAGLVALPEGTEVRLRWNASEAPDTAGYIVFRQDPGGDFHRVNSEPVSELEFVDSGLVAGNTYRYRVAAVDRSGNEGQPGDAVEGIVR